MTSDLDPLERDISRTKRELNEIFRSESLAWRAGNAAEGRARHLALLEKELENLRMIATYMEPVSPPVARDLRRWNDQMADRFGEVRNSPDPSVVQRWVTQELVPHLRRGEQLAHILASTVRTGSRRGPTPYVWPVRADAAGRQGGTNSSRGTPRRRA